MKRHVLPLIVGALLLSLGCGENGGFLVGSGPIDLSPLLQPSELCSDNPVNSIATFEDSNLTTAVRAALALGSADDLSCNLFSGLTVLNALNAGIVSLVGIQNLSSLSDLSLDGNSITDLNPMSDLTGLTILRLSNNSITDLSPLSGLVNLTSLFLDNNPVLSDIQALLDNTGLEAGDTVDLTNTNVSCADVGLMEAKGVTVSSGCP